MENLSVTAQRQSFSLPLPKPHSALSCIICTPHLEQFPSISLFYDRVGERCEKYCSQLSSREDLEGDICFRLSFKHTFADGKLSVTLFSSLCNKHTGRVIEKGSSTQLWSLERQRLMPSKKDPLSSKASHPKKIPHHKREKNACKDNRTS